MSNTPVEALRAEVHRMLTNNVDQLIRVLESNDTQKAIMLEQRDEQAKRIDAFSENALQMMKTHLTMQQHDINSMEQGIAEDQTRT